MRLTDEQVMQYNKSFAHHNVLTELKYCGWNIPNRKSISNADIHFYAWLCRSAVAMLKEPETKWHVFHENEDGVMEVECSPNNGEQILWYRKYSNDIYVTTWDDDEWAEYACNADGENFEDGDAWMELPSKP